MPIAMSAGDYNFTIEQGATFRRSLTYEQPDGTAVDLTGYTAKMQVRKDGALLLDLALGTGLTIEALAGKVTIVVTAAQTAALDFDNARYDLKLTSGSGEVTRLVQGTVKLSAQVTI